MGEQEFGRNYILGNNADINVLNSRIARETQTRPDSNLNFNSLAGTETFSDYIAPDNRAKAAGDRGELREQIRGQALVVTDGSSNTITFGGAIDDRGGFSGEGGGGGIGGGVPMAGPPGETGQHAAGMLELKAQTEGQALNQLYSGFAVPAQVGGRGLDANGNGLLGAPGTDRPAWTSAGG